MRTKALLFIQAIGANLGVTPAAAGPLAASGPEALSVDERIAVALNLGLSQLAGVPDYSVVADTKTNMCNEALRLQLAALRLVVSAQQAVQDAQAAGFTQQSAQLTVLTANLQLAQQTSQQLLTSQSADELRLAAVEAKATLTASATEANRLDIAKNTAADALRDAQALKDEAAIAAAQATATQAKADAATAQAKADLDATNLLAVQTQAKTAQDTATAAQAAVATLANRFRSATVTVPTIGLGASLDVVVTFSALADTAFVAIAEPAGLTLLGLDATELITARTATSATFRIKNVLGLVIAAGGTLTFFAYHP